MGSQTKQLPEKAQSDEYFSDFFDDDLILVEGLDPDDFQQNASVFNQDVCDLLNISDDTWHEEYTCYHN